MFAVLSDPAIYAYENAPPRSAEWLRERYARLESRRSGDGTEQWLNWVVRLRDGVPIGYVQATVDASGRALIAYEFGSAWWGQGYAREATQAMIDELIAHHGVRGPRRRAEARELPVAAAARAAGIRAGLAGGARARGRGPGRVPDGAGRRRRMSPKGRPEGEYRSAEHEGSPLSPKGRPEGEYRSAEHEGSPLSPKGRPEGEYRSAEHEGSPLSPKGRTEGEVVLDAR